MNSPTQNHEFCSKCQLTDIQGFLTRFPIFSGAPAGVVNLFAYLAKKEMYKKGESIFQEGQRCDRLFLIMSGKVDIYQHYNGRRFHFQLLSDDGINYFSELALLSGFKWFFSADAWTDVELISISREAFSKVMERYPESYQSMVKKIINIRINRFIDQSSYLLDHLSPEAWREYPEEE